MTDETIKVLDTSYLIERPSCVKDLGGEIVIPAIVLKELDGLKNNTKEDVARNARIASNNILEAQRGGRLKIVSQYRKVDMLASYADNVIVGTALKLKEKGEDVILMTTDKNMKIAAESQGMKEPEQNEGATAMMIMSIVLMFAGILMAVAVQDCELLGALLGIVGLALLIGSCKTSTINEPVKHKGPTMKEVMPGDFSCGVAPLMGPSEVTTDLVVIDH